MATIPITTLAAAGTQLDTAATAAAGGGDQAVGVDNSCLLYLNNGSGGALTCAIADPGFTPSGNPGTVTNISVAAGKAKLIPLSIAMVGNTGAVVWTYPGGVTSLTVAVFRR